MYFISADGLTGAYEVYVSAIDALEHNNIYQATNCCEPHLGRRGLYKTLSTTAKKTDQVRNTMNFIAHCDRQMDLIDIANTIEVPVWDLYDIAETLVENQLINIIDH